MPKYYRNCDELPIYNFYKVLETNELCYLYLDYDGYEKMKVIEVLGGVWEGIYEEYLKLVGDNTTILYYEVVNNLLYLETRYSVVSTLLQQIVMGRMDKDMLRAYILQLREWKYYIDDEKPLNDEISRMVRQLKASENRIRLKKEEKKQLETAKSNEKMSLIDQQVKLEQALSRNEIDTKRTVVSKWITMIKEVKLINDQRKKQNGK